METLIDAILTDEERWARDFALNRAARREIEERALLRALAEAMDGRKG